VVPPRTLREQVAQRQLTVQRVGRHHLLDVTHHEVDQLPLRCREQVGELGHDDVLDVGVGDRTLDHLGEVREHDDRGRTGVGELVVQLACGVERVDVDHRHAGAQDTEQHHRVLQRVGHHDRDAFALGQAEAVLQHRGEGRTLAFELAVGQRVTEVGVSRPVGIGGDRLLEDLDDRRNPFRIDLTGHTRRVALQPDLVHPSSLWHPGELQVSL
jgi:hypothetical protein